MSRPAPWAAAIGAAVVLVALAAAAALALRTYTGAASPAVPAAAPRAGGALLVGRVELAAGPASPAWLAKASVVVYAYALDGPRQPLALWRRPAAELPLDFKLDDSLAPNPAFRLSQAPLLVVGARLGVGEAARVQAGDWLAPPQTVQLGTHGVHLVLQPPAAAAASSPTAAKR